MVKEMGLFILKNHFRLNTIVFLVFALLFTIAVAVVAAPQTGWAQNNSLATQQLFTATHKNDLASVRESLKKGADLSARNKLRQTAIDVAVTKSYFDIVHYLLSERNKKIKKRLGLENAKSPSAPPTRSSQPTRLEPVRTVENTVGKQSPTAPRQKTKEPDLSGLKLDNTVQPPAQKPAKNPTKKSVPPPVKSSAVSLPPSEKRSSIRRLLDKFLTRFGLGDETPEIWKTDNQPALGQPSEKPDSKPAQKPAIAQAPATPEPSKKPPQTANTMKSDPKAESPLNEEQMTEEAPIALPGTTVEPPKPAAAPPKAVAEKAIPAKSEKLKTPKTPKSPKSVTPSPSKQEAPKTEIAKAPSSKESSSAFKKLIDRFFGRFNEFVSNVFGKDKKETQTAAQRPAPSKQQSSKPSSSSTGFLDTFKKTVDRVREKFIPGAKKPAADSAKQHGPIIIARPGETPPPPPGQLIDDKPPKFTPEVGTTIIKKNVVTIDTPRDVWPKQKPATSTKPELTQAEKEIAALAKGQAKGKLKPTPRPTARFAPKRDRILSNKEVEDAIVQLGGSLNELPKLEQSTPVAKAAPQNSKKPISEQKQAEVDVLDLLKSEASKVSKQQPTK